MTPNPRLFRTVLLALALLLVPAPPGSWTAAVLAPAVEAQDQAPDRTLFVHFLVIPAAFPDGRPTDPETAAFREYLLELCGGYTELGPSAGAWLDPSGRVHAEPGRAFLVSAATDRRADLSRAIRERFRQQEAYVLVWRAGGP